MLIYTNASKLYSLEIFLECREHVQNNRMKVNIERYENTGQTLHCKYNTGLFIWAYSTQC